MESKTCKCFVEAIDKSKEKEMRRITFITVAFTVVTLTIRTCQCKIYTMPFTIGNEGISTKPNNCFIGTPMQQYRSTDEWCT